VLIANYSSEVLEDLWQVHDNSFPFPNIEDPSFIERKIIVNKGKVIGCGLAKLTTEFILILDKRESLKTRVNAVSALQRNIIYSLARKGITDIHVFIKDDEKVAKFARRMGFQDCPEKYALSLHLGNGEMCEQKPE